MPPWRGWASHRQADAVTVAAELVANAVAHAGSPIGVRLELRQAKLTIAVSDDDPRPVRWPPRTARSQPVVSGLPLVMRLSYVRGCSPTHSGGKIVWAVLKYAGADTTASTQQDHNRWLSGVCGIIEP